MVYTGLHGLIGLGVSWWTSKKKPLNISPSGIAKLAYVIGCMIPDLDLLGSIFFVVTGQGLAAATSVHRTYSHSLITIGIIILLGIIIGRLGKGKGKYQSILVGLGLGMLTHDLFDLPYMVGVSLFWPLPIGTYIADQGTYRIGLFWDLPGGLANFNSALDFLFAGLFFYALYVLVRRVNKENKGLLLKILIILSFAIFIGLGAWGLMVPANASTFLLIYALAGLPYLLLMIYIPYRYRRGIYAIGETGKKR
ncbi:MAG: metal-dependent hydrolase [Candidatus Atabeyarchaeum deiterrae]